MRYEARYPDENGTLHTEFIETEKPVWAFIYKIRECTRFSGDIPTTVITKEFVDRIFTVRHLRNERSEIKFLSIVPVKKG